MSIRCELPWAIRWSSLKRFPRLRPIDVGPWRRARELEAVGCLSVATRFSLEAGIVAGESQLDLVMRP